MFNIIFQFATFSSILCIADRMYECLVRYMTQKDVILSPGPGVKGSSV